LARDPETQSAPTNSAGKLGVWALIALLLPLPWISGCTTTSVAQDIVDWTPALESAVATVDSTAALLAPADAPIFTAATIGFNAASNLLSNQAKAYLANPSASLLAQLQSQIASFQQNVNAALLQAAKIVNPASQQHALAAIQSVATIVSTLLAAIQSASSKASVTHMAAASPIKLACVDRYLDHAGAARLIAAHYREPLALAEAQVVHAEQQEIAAGF
jgi:hypothetical protein